MWNLTHVIHQKTATRAITVLAGAILACGGVGGTAHAAQQDPTPVQVRSTLPVREARYITGYTYPEGVTVGVELLRTSRIPGATGQAKVERKQGLTEIEIELDEMKPAAEFGGDFSTYVLWTVSPEGQVNNLGEFILEGNRSKLNVSSTLQTFGMIVTAEPHYLVRSPSTFVVLQDAGLTANNTSREVVRSSPLEYRGYEGVYNYFRNSLERVEEADGEVRSDVKQARVAVDLARRAGADRYAPDELRAAEAKLEELFGRAEANAGTNVMTTISHDVVRLAVDAQTSAEDRAFQAALDAERAQFADEIRQREAAIRNAESETDRARLEAENTERMLAMERRARESAGAEAEAAARRAAIAEADAASARRAREAALARMSDALSLVAETRETARGLIVSVPDILFEFDQATLKPEAREILSKVCGILLVAPEQMLDIEGHTDSVGEPGYNQQLSEQRALSVHNYLVSCGLDADGVSWQGFGETRPVASNDTNDGRSQNRRVEIVIEN